MAEATTLQEMDELDNMLRVSKSLTMREMGYWVPMPGPQQLASVISKDKRYREILYGGARGGGKTDLSIAIIGDRYKDPRAKQLVIRRNAGDLSDFEDRASQAYKHLGSKLRRNPMILSGKGLGRVLGGHLKDDDAYTKYQGHEYCRINIEELTQIPKQDMYEKLISSARSKYPDLFPQIFNTANPGGIGMAWVKKRFVTPDPEFNYVIKHEYVWYTKEGEKRITHWQTIIDKATGIWRAYIPATIDSNPILMEADPMYVMQLESLKTSNPDLYRAWREGDWNIQFGAVFEEFRDYMHVFSAFADWGFTKKMFDTSFRIAGMDWGYNDMAVIHWATFDQITEDEERAFIYREMHNNKKHPKWWAAEFAKMQQIDPVDVLALPHDAFSHLGGNKPVADRFKAALDAMPPDVKRPRIVKADKLTKEIKKAAVNALHDLLAVQSDGKAGLQIHRTCTYIIDTLPTIVYAKESGGEELDSDNEDHGLDALFYTLQTAAKTRGKLFGKAELLKKTKPSYVAGTNVTREDLGIDTATLIKGALKQDRGDWKTS